MNSKIVKVFGEMYYQVIDQSIDDLVLDRIQMVPKGQITNREQLERFCSEEISKTMPEDKPQWQMWLVPNWENDESQGLWIWKNHHSLCDGISCMALYLSIDNEYDTSKMIKFPKITFLNRLVLKLMIPLSLIK